VKNRVSGQDSTSLPLSVLHYVPVKGILPIAEGRVLKVGGGNEPPCPLGLEDPGDGFNGALEEEGSVFAWGGPTSGLLGSLGALAQANMLVSMGQGPSRLGPSVGNPKQRRYKISRP
jgi:hypothetical protein